MHLLITKERKGRRCPGKVTKVMIFCSSKAKRRYGSYSKKQPRVYINMYKTAYRYDGLVPVCFVSGDPPSLHLFSSFCRAFLPTSSLRVKENINKKFIISVWLKVVAMPIPHFISFETWRSARWVFAEVELACKVALVSIRVLLAHILPCWWYYTLKIRVLFQKSKKGMCGRLRNKICSVE